MYKIAFEGSKMYYKRLNLSNINLTPSQPRLALPPYSRRAQRLSDSPHLPLCSTAHQLQQLTPLQWRSVL